MPVSLSRPVAAGGVAGPPGTETWALIDTGASISCIDEGLALTLGLLVVDQRTVHGVAGPQIHNVYLLHCTVPALGMVVLGGFVGVTLGANTGAIIGRDFLARTIFIYDGPGGQITVCS